MTVALQTDSLCSFVKWRRQAIEEDDIGYPKFCKDL